MIRIQIQALLGFLHWEAVSVGLSFCLGGLDELVPPDSRAQLMPVDGDGLVVELKLVGRLGQRTRNIGDLQVEHCGVYLLGNSLQVEQDASVEVDQVFPVPEVMDHMHVLMLVGRGLDFVY